MAGMSSDAAGARMRGKRPRSGDPVIDRALGLLGAFDPAHRRLTLSELGRRSGLPLSTARRQAERLVAWGALERSSDGGVVVGLRLWEIASLAPRSVDLREAAMPYMEDLYEATRHRRHHVLLAVLDGDEALLVERRSARGAVAVEYRVGGRLPLQWTGVGLVLLAFAAPELQERVIAGEAGRPVADAPLNPVTLRRTLADVRRSGVAVINRRLPAPVVSVAAPVRGEADEVLAALSIVVPAGSANPKTLEPAVRAAARAVSRRRGGPGGGSARPAP